MKSAELEVKSMRIEDLKPHPRNPRKHPKEGSPQWEALKRSLDHDYFDPIIWNKRNGMLVSGHLRTKILSSMGCETVDVVVVDYDESTHDARMIAANRLHGIDDTDILNSLIENMSSEDMMLAGMVQSEIDGIAALMERKISGNFVESVAASGESSADALRDKWKTEPGQLWALGRHRLIIGSCTDKSVVDKVMGGEVAGVSFTSPPYDNQRDYDDSGVVKDWNDLLQGMASAMPLGDGGHLLVNLGIYHDRFQGGWVDYWRGWIDWMSDNGWLRAGWYVWDKGSGKMGAEAGRFALSHEFIFHFSRGRGRVLKSVAKKNVGGRAGTDREENGTLKELTSPSATKQITKLADSVIHVTPAGASLGIDHPAVFPVGLPLDILPSFGGIVYEPFSGSGTTIMACEALSRTCRATEISPRYAAVTLERYYKHTEEMPKMIG